VRRPRLQLAAEPWHPPALELVTAGGRGWLVTYLPWWLYRRLRPPT
jgi:hypothetical protein